MSAINRMMRLWERFTALYGGRWELEYGPCLSDPTTLAPLARIWAEALQDVRTDALATGLQACLDAEDRPPSLPRFLRLCGRPPRSVSRDPSHQPFALSGPRPLPAESPSDHCARLAASLSEMADRELTPRLFGHDESARKAMTRAYWLACLAEIGPFGARLSHTLNQEPAP